MSQRDGAPRSSLSKWLLRLISCVTCSDTENEWQHVWSVEPTTQPERAQLYSQPRLVRRGFEHLDEREIGVFTPTPGAKEYAARL
jgi:hypothetical protein